MPSSLTLNELVAFHDELAALVKAGVPLDHGLKELGRDLPGRLGRVTREVAVRVEAGVPLEDALEGLSEMPAMYRALVRAGVRADHLPAALGSVASALRRQAELRRQLVLGLAYPILLLGTAYVFLVATVLMWTPVDLTLGLKARAPGSYVIEWLAVHKWYWMPWIPLAAILLASFSWIRSARPRRSRRGPRGRRIRMHTPGSVRRTGHVAVFAELLAALTRCGVPLPESLRLAGDACGDPWIAGASRELATTIEGGGRELPEGLQPFLSWLVIASPRDARLPERLESMARDYRHRAQHGVTWLTVTMPLSLTLLVGGGVLAVYIALVLAPWLRTIYDLMAVPNVVG